MFKNYPNPLVSIEEDDVEKYSIQLLIILSPSRQIDDDALNVLSEVGSKTTLRYAVQLLTPSAITARIAGRQNIVREDIKVCYPFIPPPKFSSTFTKHFLGIINT